MPCAERTGPLVMARRAFRRRFSPDRAAPIRRLGREPWWRRSGGSRKRRPIDGHIVSAHNNGTSTRPWIPVQAGKDKLTLTSVCLTPSPAAGGQRHADSARKEGFRGAAAAAPWVYPQTRNGQSNQRRSLG